MLKSLFEAFVPELNTSKESIRGVDSAFAGKLEGCRMTQEAKTIGELGCNSALSGCRKDGIEALSRVAEQQFPALKQSIRGTCRSLTVADGIEQAQHLVGDLENEKAASEKNMAELTKREKALIEAIGRIQSRETLVPRSPIQKILGQADKSLDRVRNQQRELVEHHSRLTMLRINRHGQELAVNIASRLIQYIEQEVIPELEIELGKLDQAIASLLASASQTASEIANSPGYQIDLGMEPKLGKVRAQRITAQAAKSLALESRPLLRLSASEIAERLTDQCAESFSDLGRIQAFDRVRELHPDRSELSCQIEHWVLKQASPYLPLNDQMLNAKPLHQTVISVPDEKSSNELSAVLSERQLPGACKVSLNPDPEAMCILTMAAGVPAFALPKIGSWRDAALKRESDGPYAVFPERRWREYRPILPIASEARTDTLAMLGIVGGSIDHYSKGFYGVNGQKIHGIKSVKDLLAGNRNLQTSILDRWIGIFRSEGLTGVASRIQNRRDALAHTNGLLRVGDDILQRLVSATQQGPISEERLSQILVGAE